ncbi:histone-lysine N-methyltransferase SMYD3-like [Galendromus occidentalis]|uniref:Histone-lysine N-methyltransferase SMYD3-like n=1 Tax=Galendromus occidentalis TaxID=34638 RepID=A0AAJ7WIP5_9ACAR|nr:histone-lysine N-methyltransferase SMYD3-like [Galendromus occidentalis]
MSSSKTLDEPLTYSTGDIIHEDDPYACALSSDVLSAVCSYCISRGTSHSCEKCKRLHYCSKRCKSKDRVFHRLECQVLRALGPEDDVLDEETRMVIRTLDRFIRERQSHSISEASFFSCTRTIYDLLSHIEDLSPSEFEQAKERAETILSIVSPFVFTQLEEVMDILQRCRINCHSIVDHNDFHFFSRGRAVYLAASKTNHSCVTSNEYVQIFNGRKILLRAIQDFRIDDPLQMTIHYMPPTLPYESRLRRCLNNYYFICSCRKCVWQARNPEPDQAAGETVAEIEQAFEEYHSSDEWYEIGTKLLEKVKNLPEKNFYVYWLLIQMQPTCFELGKYKESIEYGIRATNGAESILSLEPLFHYLCQAMVKLGWNKSSNPNHGRFAETYKLTKTLYSITHGSNHKIVQGLRKMRGTWWAKGSDKLYSFFRKQDPVDSQRVDDVRDGAIEVQ